VAGSRDELVELRNAGLTYAEIGRILGISRERARQIVKGHYVKKPVINSRAMLTVGDVAQLLGLHISTVRRWSNKGILKSYRINSRGDRRFRREDVDGLLNRSYKL
jgi:excisionase family DNA binding protein